ncbi:MAG: bifunctional precorrin-2 dehydrogenase/sirohydrochlorin ferrochelatase [Deltaproteobacteria bacterium]|jgi:precorrin-2 dehydrogenase/sirohydrochlorin ferrochelatase|nr:bifunctional precorrin-2 dehydrogenase/sirohydrochlorin ferrochelatase [Deltaproteobacteria bacterium]
MGYLSVNINFFGRETLLIGAGKVGRRKLNDLLQVGAKLTVVEPTPSASIRRLALSGRISLVSSFYIELLDKKPWIFVALADPSLVGELVELAKDQGLMINVADRPRDCDFIMPALVREGPFKLAVSTDGASPALSAKVSSDLRKKYSGYGILTQILGLLRPLVLSSGLGEERRKAIFKSLAQEESLPELIKQGDFEKVKSITANLIKPLIIPPDFPWPLP